MFQCAISFFSKSSYHPELTFLWIVMIGSWSWSHREWLRSNSFHTLVWILLSTLKSNKYFQCTCIHTPITNVCVSLCIYTNTHLHTHTHLYSDYTTMHISIGMDVATLYRWMWFQQAHIYMLIYEYLHNIFIYEFIYSLFHSTNKPNVSYESGSVPEAWNISVNTQDKYPCPF